jgi:DNA-binding HxlR family transcriptional regulator
MPSTEHRSGCPVGISLDILGDRWSLLIVRDLMVRGYRTFTEFESSGEGIATNILTARLKRLQETGVITREFEESDRRKASYRLTEKGVDLAPLLLELLLWGARHEKTTAPRALVTMMERNRPEILTEIRRRWRERDSTPLIPRFAGNTRKG